MANTSKKMAAVSPFLQKFINWSSIIGALGTVIFCIWAYYAGILQSKETLSAFIKQAGIWGPPLFIFLQILQTVVPIIPGALTSVAAVFIYGHIIGTIYNYVGIVIGCAIIFIWRVPTVRLLSNLSSANAPMTNTLAGWMRTIVLSVFSSL